MTIPPRRGHRQRAIGQEVPADQKRMSVIEMKAMAFDNGITPFVNEANAILSDQQCEATHKAGEEIMMGLIEEIKALRRARNKERAHYAEIGNANVHLQDRLSKLEADNKVMHEELDAFRMTVPPQYQPKIRKSGPLEERETAIGLARAREARRSAGLAEPAEDMPHREPPRTGIVNRGQQRFAPAGSVGVTRPPGFTPPRAPGLVNAGGRPIPPTETQISLQNSGTEHAVGAGPADADYEQVRVTVNDTETAVVRALVDHTVSPEGVEVAILSALHPDDLDRLTNMVAASQRRPQRLSRE